MTEILQGAYVRAWVWVDLGPEDDKLTDDEIRGIAHNNYHKDGEIEIELLGAKVSRSYDEG